jgi:ribose transport system substrate-binding protein
MSSLNEESASRLLASLTDPTSRRAFLRVTTAAGMACALPIGLGACGDDDESSSGSAASGGDDTTTGIIANQVATLADEYFISWNEGLGAAASALGCKTLQLTTDADSAKELGQVRQLKSQQAKMLVSLNLTANVPAIAKQCESNGVFYAPSWEIAAGYTPPDAGDHFVAFLTPPSEVAGYESAKALFESIDGEGKVVHIKGGAGPTDEYRTLGVQRAAKEFPGIEIVGDLRADYTREGARKVMLNSVSAHPDMRAVFAQSDAMALGVLSVIDQNSKLKDVKVAGIDGLKELLPRLAEGKNFVATHNSLPPFQSGFAAVLAFDALNGWKPRTAERMLYTGSVLITQENADDVNTKLYGGKDPFDWAKMSRTLHPDDWDPQNEITPIDPEEHFAPFSDQLPLNEVWADVKSNGEREAVADDFVKHYKQGPFKA